MHLKLTENELDILVELTDLFEIFQKASLILQTGTDVSAHLVLLLYEELVTDISEKIPSCVHIPFLYNQALESLKNRFVISNYFNAGSILDPGQAHLPMVKKYLTINNVSSIQVINDLFLELDIQMNELSIPKQNKNFANTVSRNNFF